MDSFKKNRCNEAELISKLFWISCVVTVMKHHYKKKYSPFACWTLDEDEGKIIIPNCVTSSASHAFTKCMVFVFPPCPLFSPRFWLIQSLLATSINMLLRHSISQSTRDVIGCILNDYLRTLSQLLHWWLGIR